MTLCLASDLGPLEELGLRHVNEVLQNMIVTRNINEKHCANIQRARQYSKHIHGNWVNISKVNQEIRQFSNVSQRLNGKSVTQPAKVSVTNVVTHKHICHPQPLQFSGHVDVHGLGLGLASAKRNIEEKAEERNVS